MEAGLRVRLIDNPSKIGTLSGLTRKRADTIYYGVIFTDSSEDYFRETDLDVISDNRSEDPLMSQ